MSPSEPKPPNDATVALLKDPYRFISERCRRLGTEGGETHVLLKDTTCLKGPEACALFYDPERIKREGAMPSPIRKTLLGEGGVQGLDGEAHRHRKQLFMDLLAPERVRALGDLVGEEWTRVAAHWAATGGTFASTMNCTRCSPAQFAPGRKRHSETAMFNAVPDNSGPCSMRPERGAHGIYGLATHAAKWTSG